jgi:hypothetical protein
MNVDWPQPGMDSFVHDLAPQKKLLLIAKIRSKRRHDASIITKSGLIGYNKSDFNPIQFSTTGRLCIS